MLPNGTWVGIVGDTNRGEVDFGFMAAITYERFPCAEFCAPINFAYLGFVTGTVFVTNNDKIQIDLFSLSNLLT